MNVLNGVTDVLITAHSLAGQKWFININYGLLIVSLEQLCLSPRPDSPADPKPQQSSAPWRCLLAGVRVVKWLGCLILRAAGPRLAPLQPLGTPRP